MGPTETEKQFNHRVAIHMGFRDHPKPVTGPHHCQVCPQTFFTYHALFDQAKACGREIVRTQCQLPGCDPMLEGMSGIYARHTLDKHGWDLFMQNEPLKDPDKPVCYKRNTGFYTARQFASHNLHFDNTRPWEECTIGDCRLRTFSHKSRVAHRNFHGLSPMQPIVEWVDTLPILDWKPLDLPPLERALLVERHSDGSALGWDRHADRRRRSQYFDEIKTFSSGLADQEEIDSLVFYTSSKYMPYDADLVRFAGSTSSQRAKFKSFRLQATELPMISPSVFQQGVNGILTNGPDGFTCASLLFKA